MPEEEMFSKKVTSVLIEHICPAVIASEENYETLEKYASMGFVGYSLLDLTHLDPDCYEKGTAGLTISGLIHLQIHLKKKKGRRIKNWRSLMKIGIRINEINELELLE